MKYGRLNLGDPCHFDRYKGCTYRECKSYLIILPFGSNGGSHDIINDFGPLTSTLISAGADGTEIN